MIPASPKSLRVIGFDDAPFQRKDAKVSLSGVVCRNTRFEGMLWGEATPDGLDATSTIITMVSESKYHAQLHAILLDGIAIGGLNLIDLPKLAGTLRLPCIAVMRKQPDIQAMKNIIMKHPHAAEKLAMLKKAGPIFQTSPFFFQVSGIDSSLAASVLSRVTDTGHVPEALRIAHHIGTAIKTGTSGKRA